MKKILIFILIMLLPNFMQCSEINNKTISDILTEQVISGKKYNPYTSMLLLAQLRISDKNEKSLIYQYNKEKNVTKKLFIANIFVKRLIGQYEKDFIQLFPAIQKKNNIISLTYNTEYVHIVSPLYDTLIVLAYDHEEALSKLFISLKYIQGGYYESLYDAVNKIYKLNPKYVEKVANKNNINLKTFLFKND